MELGTDEKAKNSKSNERQCTTNMDDKYPPLEVPGAGVSWGGGRHWASVGTVPKGYGTPTRLSFARNPSKNKYPPLEEPGAGVGKLKA